MSLKERKNKLLEQLQALKLFPSNNEVRILRSRIQKQLERIEKQITEVKKEPTPDEKRRESIARRSSKLRKHWRYVRLIRDNFPNLKISEIRKQFSKRRTGQEVSIPDAIWQNPSL